jgi:hypothetical protein
MSNFLPERMVKHAANSSNPQESSTSKLLQDLSIIHFALEVKNRVFDIPQTLLDSA